MLYEAARQKYSGLFSTRESFSEMVESNRNNGVLKEKVAQTLADCSSARKRRAKEKWFQIVGYDRLGPNKAKIL